MLSLRAGRLREARAQVIRDFYRGWQSAVCLLASDKHTRYDGGVIGGPESVGQAACGIGADQLSSPRSYFAVGQDQVDALIELRYGIVIRFSLPAGQSCALGKYLRPNVVVAGRDEIGITSGLVGEGMPARLNPSR